MTDIPCSSRITKKSKMAAASEKAATQRKNFAARPIQQQQVALNLAQLAKKEKDVGLSENTVDALIQSLIVSRSSSARVV